MIVKPVLIVGTPRSGTSMLQKILRNHPDFWSLPSESDLIWDRFCHPAMRGWDSECMDEGDMTPRDRGAILRMFEAYVRPASYWEPLERANLIWGFRRMPLLRKLMRSALKHALPLTSIFGSKGQEKRLLEKTASNCLRLGYVNKVFPESRIIYPVRDGRNNVNSLINAWRHPKRFFTYDVPETLDIKGYEHDRWKFVLPHGWRDYTDRSLAEVCAFQWRACHEAMIAETAKDQYQGRVFRIKLEDLVAQPNKRLAELAKFLDLPFDDYFTSVAEDLPIVNSPDNNTNIDKWRGENQALIEEVMAMILPTMRRLDYKV